MSEPSAAIPKGSVVLVTGLTGYIATHIAQQLFALGYPKFVVRFATCPKRLGLGMALYSPKNTPPALSSLSEFPAFSNRSAPSMSQLRGVAAVAAVATISEP